MITTNRKVLLGSRIMSEHLQEGQWLRKSRKRNLHLQQTSRFRMSVMFKVWATPASHLGSPALPFAPSSKEVFSLQSKKSAPGWPKTANCLNAMNGLCFCPSKTRMLLFEQVPALLERSVPPPRLPFTWSYRESGEHPDTYVGAAPGEFPKHSLMLQHNPSLPGSSLGEFVRSFPQRTSPAPDAV